MVKRFYMADIFTEPNRNYRSAPYTSPALSRYRAVRIVNYVELAFRVPADHQRYGNRIAVPLLILNHRNVNTTTATVVATAPTEIDFTFRITFTKPNRVVAQLLDILLATFLIGALVAAIFDAYCYRVRQQRTVLDVDIFVRFAISLCGHVAVALFGAASLCALYAMAICHWQQTVRIILPLTEQQPVMETLVYVAVPLRLCRILQQLWRQCTCDIFFIDWERPRVYDPLTAAATKSAHHHHHLLDTTTTAPSSISSTIGGVGGGGGGSGKPTVYDGVSAWRNYFVANEWLKLQTQRKSNCWLQLLMIVAASMVRNQMFHHYGECLIIFF